MLTATAGLYASEAYLAQRPAPRAPSLEGHDLLAVAEINLRTGVDRWFADHVEGGNVVLRSSSAEELTRLCAEGMGIALLFHLRAARTPGLVHLKGFPDFELPHFPGDPPRHGSGAARARDEAGDPGAHRAGSSRHRAQGRRGALTPAVPRAGSAHSAAARRRQALTHAAR